MINWKNIFKKKDSAFEVIEIMQTVNNRKLKHLHDCVMGLCAAMKTEYIPPTSFMTDYEQKVLERLTGKNAEELKKVVNKLYEDPQK